MKLYFDKRPFSWDDSYTIYEETDRPAYQVIAESGKRINTITLQNANEMEIGKIVCKRNIFGRWSFKIFFDDNLIGTVEKKHETFTVTRYQLYCNRWRVFGNIMGFEYDIFDGKYIVMHAGNDDEKYEDKYVIDTSYSNNERPAILVALAMEAANSTLKPRK